MERLSIVAGRFVDEYRAAIEQHNCDRSTAATFPLA
jgi:hypothetical protein